MTPSLSDRIHTALAVLTGKLPDVTALASELSAAQQDAAAAHAAQSDAEARLAADQALLDQVGDVNQLTTDVTAFEQAAQTLAQAVPAAPTA